MTDDVNKPVEDQDCGFQFSDLYDLFEVAVLEGEEKELDSYDIELLNIHFLQYCGRLNPEYIDPVAIAVRVDLLPTAKLKRAFLNTLQRVFEFGLKKELITQNPCTELV